MCFSFISLMSPKSEHLSNTWHSPHAADLGETPARARGRAGGRGGMRGPLGESGAPDEKHHYHNDTSNYTVIRIPLRPAWCGSLAFRQHDPGDGASGAAPEAFNPFSGCSPAQALDIELQHS